MSTQPSTTRRNSKRLNHDRNFKLRFELLEERRLLSADGTFVPSDTDVFSQEQFESSTHCSHDLQDDELSSIMQAVANAVTRESGPDPGGRHWNSNECASSNDVLDPFFEEFGFYINNKSYCLLSDLQYKPSIFFSTSLLNEELEDLPNENGELSNERETWDLEITASVGGCQSPSTLEGGYLQLHEGHDSVLDFPGSMADPVSTDYMVVTLPALPEGYVTTITFGGSASEGPDYYVCAPYGNSYWSVSSGYLHSGPSVDLYVIVIDDRISEADDETVSITMGTPVPQPDLTVTPYNFNQIENTVSAKIIDNDGWKIGVVAETGGNTSETVISETNNGETNIRVSRLDDGTGHGSDLHYYIDATIAVSGTANASDYQIYLNNANGGRSLITPSNGRFTVRIQENEAFATLTIVARDDSVVEQLYETINLSVVEAKGYPPFISFSADTTPFTVCVKDNDKLTLNTVQFKNNLDLISDSQNSFGENWKDTVHWINLYPNQTLPVAYSSGSTMKCAITLSGQRDYGCTFQVRMKWNYNTSNAGNSVYSDWITVTGSSVEVPLGQSFAELFGEQRAYYDENSTIEWEFRVAGEEERGEDGDMGESENPLYVTYKQPSATSPYYHSLIHIGCVAASSAVGSNESDVFQILWDKIASKSIYKVKLEDGRIVNDGLLTYYGKALPLPDEPGYDSSTYNNIMSDLEVTEYPTGNFISDQFPSVARSVCNTAGYMLPGNIYTDGFNVDSLLYYKDGTCGTWQDFMVNLCALQGLECERLDIVVSDDTNSDVFKVNPSLTGQGGEVPLENTWSDHALVKYNEKVYDPSYGAYYGLYANGAYLSAFISNLHSWGYTVNCNYGDYGKIYIPVLLTEIPTSYFTEV